MMEELKTVKLKIEGMHCISCVGTIEDALKIIDGITEVKVDFATSVAYVTYDSWKVTPEKFISRVTHAGYHADLIEKEMKETSTQIPRLFQDPQFLSFLISALLTAPLMFDMVGEWFGWNLRLSSYMELLFATVVQFWCGRMFYRGAYFSLKAKSPNMDLLIAIGTSFAYFYSLAQVIVPFGGHLYFETSASIITIVLLGRWIEGSTKHKATLAIEKLMALRPSKVQVERGGRLMEVSPDEVKEGEIFYVRPGENVAVDGEVISGKSVVDESLLTGESLPVSKKEGDLIYSGTTNFEGLVKAEALRVGEHTVLSQIVHLVEKLHMSKAPIQRLADQISAIFVPLVLIISLITLLSWWLLWGSFTQGILSAVATVVIACPCALGIATPMVILVASGLGAKLGLVFQDAVAIETCAKVKSLVFDKTGTLTVGKPKVDQEKLYGSLQEDEVIQIMSSIELFSQHPLAHSIITYAKEKGIEREPVTHVEAISGKGIRGEKRGVLYTIGSLSYARESGCTIPDEIIHSGEQWDRTALFLWSGQELLAGVTVVDPLRKNSKEVISLLKERGIELLLLSGDRNEAAFKVAKEVGIDQYLAEVLPDKKAETVVRNKKSDKILGMVGDGMNDAPALAAADVGFSIGGGSDIAIAASDITLLHNDLMGVIDAIELSQATVKKIKQNLVLAFVYNTLAIPIAALGWLNPIVAAVAMMLSSISVVLNSVQFNSWLPTSKR